MSERIDDLPTPAPTSGSSAIRVARPLDHPAIWAVLVALPGVALAVVAAFHPTHLGYPTSQRWYAVHVAGLVVMPLLGLGLTGLVWRRRDPVAWLVRLTAYGFAVFYTGLDVLAGIGTAYVIHQGGPQTPRPIAVHYLFGIGASLGRIGSISLMVCALLLLLDALVDVGWRGLGGVVVLYGAYLIHEHHIFPPQGLIGAALVGLGSAALVLGRAAGPGRRRTTPAPVTAGG